MTKYTSSLAFASLLALAAGSAALAADDATVAAARKEGAVSIYSATDLSLVQPMIDAFNAKYPEIRVDYNDLNTNIIYNRVISEAAAGQVGGDVVWNSAMDLQMRLAKDGYIDSYESDQKAALPEWAEYEGQLYAATVEPIGIIYNKLAIPEDKVPTTRAALTAFFASPEAAGKVATFDPEKSGIGFLIQTNDANTTEGFWEMIEAFGGAGGKVYSSTGSMRETVSSGENVVAFNLIGSYALDWAKDSQTLGVAFDPEHTAAFSRLAGILAKAPHPNAAKVFLDFLLSQEGQSQLAAHGLPSVRTDVTTGFNLDTIGARVGGHLAPIPVDETLLDYSDPMKRVKFLREWTGSAKG